ncbi:MAG: T9SS type A sorting domain-containing protein [Bacteroidota bacterium]|nr:T9SS type A sorting domain-containing protein [Bacteroidota bacterium]
MVKQTVRTILIITLLGNFVSAKAQHISLSNFYLIPIHKEVLMYWIIDSGSTCNGITIWHSTDSLNYVEIGYIGGVCGSSSSSTPYNFTDKSPLLNTANYYKLRLGYSQFTEVKAITIKYNEPGRLYVYPNPSNDQTTVEFNNDYIKHYSMSITNNLGNVIYKKDEIFESQIFLNTSGWNPGTYYITLTDTAGKLLKEKLIVSK